MAGWWQKDTSMYKKTQDTQLSLFWIRRTHVILTYPVWGCQRKVKLWLCYVVTAYITKIQTIYPLRIVYLRPKNFCRTKTRFYGWEIMGCPEASGWSSGCLDRVVGMSCLSHRGVLGKALRWGYDENGVLRGLLLENVAEIPQKMCPTSIKMLHWHDISEPFTCNWLGTGTDKIF